MVPFNRITKEHWMSALLAAWCTLLLAVFLIVSSTAAGHPDTVMTDSGWMWVKIMLCAEFLMFPSLIPVFAQLFHCWDNQ